MLMISNLSFAGENLMLGCDGISSGVLFQANGKEIYVPPTKKSESYLFKNGILLKGKKVISCNWSDEEVNCESLSEKPFSLNILVTLNRITGKVDAMTSLIDSKGEVFSREEFSGSCHAQKRKF